MYYRLTIHQNYVERYPSGNTVNNFNEVELASPFLSDLTDIIDRMEASRHSDGPRHFAVSESDKTITATSYTIDSVAGKLERKDAPDSYDDPFRMLAELQADVMGKPSTTYHMRFGKVSDNG